METANNYSNKKLTSKMQNQDSLVGPHLYIECNNASEDEIRSSLKGVEPMSVEIRPNNIALLRFSEVGQAEKAFACYNYSKSEKFYIKLYFNEPTPGDDILRSGAIILQVRNLPSITNLSLYDRFRPFGPLFSCRIQFQEGKFKGVALVQFFKQEDADSAANAMNGSNIDGKNIIVQPYHKNNHPSKIRTNVPNHNFNNLPSAAGHTFPSQGSNNNNNNNNNNQTPASPSTESGPVDPCNLFIKNLDSNISSSDLFHHFRTYGRIISARVMRDQESGNSKGFGFVSYTTAEEADRAKKTMHGKTLGSKQIVVRLHEPKKMREVKLAIQYNGSSTPMESRVPSRRNSGHFNINNVNEFAPEDLTGLAPKARREVLMSELQKRFRYIPSVPPHEVNPIVEYLLTSKTADVLQMLKDAQLLTQKITEARSIIINDRKRRGNEEVSVPTTSIINNNIVNNNNTNNAGQQIPQREKFLKAINKICPHNADEVLDLLMTLSSKDRALCSFNADILNRKIIEANGALEASALEAVNNDGEAANPKPCMSADSTSVYNIPTTRAVEPHPVRSYGTEVPAVAAVVSNSGINTPEYKEIEEFMDGLKNKPVHEQKQKLGDRLFPKVKSLGLKSATASKVTINLLDTDDLRELAHSMNDEKRFEAKVQAAAAKVVSK